MGAKRGAGSAVPRVVAMTLLSALVPPLQAGDAAKGPNVDPAKRGSSPSTEAVAQAALGVQVARHADRN